MKKQLTLLAASLFALSAMAQEPVLADGRPANIDWSGDSLITSVKDIYDEHQAVATHNFSEAHFAKVWGGRRFFNISMNFGTLNPKGMKIKKGDPHPIDKVTNTPLPTDQIATGASYNGGVAPKYKSDWGLSLQKGRNIRLHKKAIGNVLQFNLDYTGLDLNVNRFSAEKPGMGEYIFDSNNKILIPSTSSTATSKSTEGVYYNHWNFEKYDITYGMDFGPSITLAPFNGIKNNSKIHFLKLNVFYHFGYNMSALIMKKDENADANRSKSRSGEPQCLIGWGPRQSMGLILMYSRIGLGFEHCWGNFTYKNMFGGEDDFDKTKYKLGESVNRVFLSIRLGKN